MLGADVDLLVKAAALILQLRQRVDDLCELLELAQLLASHLGSASSPGLEVGQHSLFPQQRQDLSDGQHVGDLQFSD